MAALPPRCPANSYVLPVEIARSLKRVDSVLQAILMLFYAVILVIAAVAAIVGGFVMWSCAGIAAGGVLVYRDIRREGRAPLRR